MAGNLVKRVMLKIVADDGDSEAKLDRITAKAEELGRLHPDIKVKVDSAAASAKLAVLKREMKDTADAANKDTGGGFMSRLSGLAPQIAQMGMFQKVMLGLGAATTFLEPVAAGAIVAVGGLASGLAAAGAGLGVFGLVAKGVYSQVSGAEASYQQAMNTTGAARAKALLAYRQQMGALTGPQKQLVHGISDAQNAWQSFVAKNTSGVASIMHQGFGLLPHLFSSMQPFMAPVESALHNIISDLGHGIQSAGFKSFIQTLAANAGPDLQKIAGIIGHIVVGLGGILKAFMPVSSTIMGGLDNWTAKFAHWGQTLSGHSGFQSLMTMFRTETPIAMHVLGNLGGIIKTVVADMTGLSGFGNSKTFLELAMSGTGLVNVLLKLNPSLVRVGLYLLAAASTGKRLAGVFGGLSAGVTTVKDLAAGIQNFSAGFSSADQAAAKATGTWGTWGGKVSSVFSSAKTMVTGFLQKIGLMTAATEAQTAATEGETVAQEGLDGAMDANPIGLIIAAIGLLVLGFVELWKHSAAFRDFWIGLWHDITHLVGDAVSFIEGHWKLILSILTGPIGAATIFIVGHWNQITSGASHMIGDVIGFFTSLPGRIWNAISGLAQMLWNAGVNAIKGLIGGIESMAGAVGSAVSGIASKVAGFFGLSPAREGPLSGGGAPFIRGQHFAMDLGAGMTSAVRGPAAAAAQLAGAMGAATARGTAPGGAAGGQRVVLEVTGGESDFDQFMLTWIRKNVRIRGGNVQTAFGRP